MSSRIILVLSLIALCWSEATAQAPPASQCVTTAVAGGTGDAITIPRLPCVATTTLLTLSTTAGNTTTTPTLKAGTDPALPIVQFDGTAPRVGLLAAGQRWLLTSNGSSWFLMNTGPQASTIGPVCPSIIDFGGSRDGVTDNKAALDRAIAAYPSAPCVYFPTGKYAFNAQYVYNLNTNDRVFTLYGDAAGTSTLYWPSGGGLLVNGTANRTAVHFRNLSVQTGAVNVGVGIDLEWGAQHNNNMPSSTFTNVFVSGNPIGTNYWNTGIKLNGIGAVNFYGIDIFGDTNGGLSTSHSTDLLLTAPASNLSYIYNIVNSNFYGGLYGLYYGPNVQGVTVVNCNFTLNWNGIYLPPTSVGQSGLMVLNSQFDNTGDNILVDTGANTPQISIKENMFFLASNTKGISVLGSPAWFDFAGNQFDPATSANPQLGTGIYVGGGLGTNLIRDNVCVHLDKCVELGTAPQGVKVSGTRIDGLSTKLAVINGSTSATNFVTGFINPANSETNFPLGLGITAAANNGSGNIRLTVADTTVLTNGEIVMVNAPGVANMPTIAAITIIDATHLDLRVSAFSGSYTSGGVLWVMP
jgi:Pectate lyase superfamily protein